MPINYHEIHQLLLDTSEDLTNTIIECIRGSVITCLSSGIGGLLFGHLGQFIGAVAGSAYSIASGNSYGSVAEAIRNMSAAVRVTFVTRLSNIINQINFSDLRSIAGQIRLMITSSPSDFLMTQSRLMIA